MRVVTDLREQRRTERRWAIQQAACTLVMEHGFDGFTMDDLAAAVGVSRRTLFNHVRDKESAVLGEDMTRADNQQALARFTAAAPSSDLESDILDLMREMIVLAERHIPATCHHNRLIEQALAADPKLAQLAFHRLQADFHGLTESVCTRQRWVAGDLRARVAVARAASLLPVVFDEVRRRGGAGSFRQVFDDVRTAGLRSPAAPAHPRG